MIYSFHHYYSWVKGGIESGQAYRAKIFRSMGLDAKFVFATLFPEGDIYGELKSLSYLDSEIIWMYGFFTDCPVSPCRYTYERFEKMISGQEYIKTITGNIISYKMRQSDFEYRVWLLDENSIYIKYIESYSENYLIKKDYYTDVCIYSEYYMCKSNRNILYMRRYYNKDRSAAYEELLQGDEVMYIFPDKILYSREELVEYMIELLHPTDRDTFLIDGEPGMIDASAFINSARPGKVGYIIHNFHYLQSSDEKYVIWAYYYEYALSHPEKIDFFVTNTETQANDLRMQYKSKGMEANVITIPVFGLDQIKEEIERKTHSLISAGRLENDKNTDKLIEAVVKAKKFLPDLSLDIYGSGPLWNNLSNQIKETKSGSYIKLRGYQKLDDIYQKYDAYLCASRFESFGITLLEAMGAGLPIIGFDTPYGPQNFIKDNINGFKVNYGDVDALSNGIVRLFTEEDIECFRMHSYEKAKSYLTEEIEDQWRQLLMPMT